MTIEYTMRYGLLFDPFLKNSTEIFVDNACTKEALARLDLLAKAHGFGVLTGPPGSGKTTIVRKFAQSLNISLYQVIYSPLSTLSLHEFYRKMAMDLGLQPAFRKTTNFSNIQSAVMHLSRDSKKTPVFIIDEANYLQSDILTDLEMLFNFEMDSKDRAIVLLVGLTDLNNKLNLGKHEALHQRIIMNHNLEKFNKNEGRAYIQTKLDGADCHRQIFEDPAIEAILNCSDNIPRLINKLCTRSMVLANAKQMDSITAEVVADAMRDCELD